MSNDHLPCPKDGRKAKYGFCTVLTGNGGRVRLSFDLGRGSDGHNVT